LKRSKEATLNVMPLLGNIQKGEEGCYMFYPKILNEDNLKPLCAMDLKDLFEKVVSMNKSLE
jgi:hypothetical protein